MRAILMPYAEALSAAGYRHGWNHTADTVVFGGRVLVVTHVASARGHRILRHMSIKPRFGVPILVDACRTACALLPADRDACLVLPDTRRLLSALMEAAPRLDAAAIAAIPEAATGDRRTADHLCATMRAFGVPDDLKEILPEAAARSAALLAGSPTVP